MIRKYHNHKPQTTLWHREGRGRAAQPSRDTRKTNQAKQPAPSPPPPPHQDDCNARTDTKQRATKHRTITDSHMSDCRSKVHKFDPGPVPCFCGDLSWNNFWSFSSLPLIQERLLSVTSESMYRKYWLTTWPSLPRKKVQLGELTIPTWP